MLLIKKGESSANAEFLAVLGSSFYLRKSSGKYVFIYLISLSFISLGKNTEVNIYIPYIFSLRKEDIFINFII